MLERRPHGLLQAVGAATHSQPVNHQLDVVGLVAVHLHVVCQLLHLAVHSHPQESFFPQLGEQFAVVAFTGFYQRGEDVDVLALILLFYQLEDALLRVFHHPLAAHVRVGNPHSGIQQTHKVVYLRHRTHGGAGILVGGLLLDGDNRAQTVDAVHVGPFDIAHKVPGISRKGLHVTALSLGMDSVEGQA